MVAEILKRLSIRDCEDLKTYLQLSCADKVKAIFDGAVNQSCNGETWPKLNVVHTKMENQGNEILCEGE